MKRGNEKLRRRRRQLVQSLAWFIPVCMIFLGVIVSLSSSSSFLKHYNVVYDDNDNPSIEGQQPDREHDLNHEDAEIGAGNITEFDVSKGIVTTKETTSTVTATTTHQDISSVTTSTITVPRDTTTPNRNDGSRNEVVVVENGSNEDKSKIGDDEEFFGACLLVMDDVSTTCTLLFSKGFGWIILSTNFAQFISNDTESLFSRMVSIPLLLSTIAKVRTNLM